MTDEELRAICLNAAAVEVARWSGMGSRGPSVHSEALRLYEWVKGRDDKAGFGTNLTGFGGGGGGALPPGADVQEFRGAGTWSKPDLPSAVVVTIGSGGNGGKAGRG